jgi:hypothetical protein
LPSTVPKSLACDALSVVGVPEKAIENDPSSGVKSFQPAGIETEGFAAPEPLGAEADVEVAVAPAVAVELAVDALGVADPPPPQAPATTAHETMSSAIRRMVLLLATQMAGNCRRSQRPSFALGAGANVLAETRAFAPGVSGEACHDLPLPAG